MNLRILLHRWRRQSTPPPPIAHGPAGIRAVGHREYVGGKWDAIGRLQFDFLVARGLRPHHYLLDIACGSLRGGVHFIPHLDAGHYLGIDKEPDLIRAGLEQELAPDLRESKRPNLIVDDEFTFERFAVRPDVALAQSLFTHLPPELIGKCFRNLRRVIADGGEFYATYFEATAEAPNPEVPHDWGRFAYTRVQMERFGADAGWRFEYIGDWRHPRGQIMTCYRPA